MIGFIGLGNMATAMIGGMLSKKVVEKADVIGADINQKSRDKVSESFHIQVTDNNLAVARQADILILAIKPQFFEEVILQIKDEVKENVIILSIAAGKTLEWLEQCFEKPIKLTRAMPNTPALIGEGCSGVCKNSNVTDEEMQKILEIMESFGMAQEVPERLMDAVMAVSGSSPAYIFMIIEAMADGAVAAGMPREQAYQFAAQAVRGSAGMVLEMKKHPGELKDMVCSPGGTTIEAVKMLEKNGIRSAIMEGMEACINKSKQL